MNSFPPRWSPLWVAGLFALLALAATWPVATDPARISLAGPYNNDFHLNLYLVFWGAHALTTDPLRLHHANMYHPEPYAFAYCDMPLSLSLLMLPVVSVTHNPVLVHNLLLLVGAVLGGMGFFLLARDLTRSQGAALFGAAVFVFNPSHFGRYLQLPLFCDFWMPWFAWAFLRFLRGARESGKGGDAVPGQGSGALHRRAGPRGRRDAASARRWAAGAGVFLGLHALSGAHNAVFGALLAVALVLHEVISRGWRRPRCFWTGLAACVAVTLLLVGPVFWPYLAVEGELLKARIAGGRTLWEHGLKARDFVTGASRLYVWLDRALGWPSALFEGYRRPLFPGAAPLLLGILGILLPGGAAGRVAGRGERGRGHRPLAWALDGALLVLAAAAVAAARGSRPPLSPLWEALGPGAVWAYPALGAVVLTVRLVAVGGVPHVVVAAARSLAAVTLRDPERRFWFLFFGLCLALSLGPAGGLYGIVSSLPGARLIRVPRRFMLPAAFALSALAAYGAAALAQRLQQRRLRRPLTAFLAVAFAAESVFAPLPYRIVEPEPLPHLTWLARQEGDFAVLEVPIAPDDPTIATRQLLQSIHHWKRLLVGYGGYRSPDNVRRMRRLARDFPSDAALDELRELDVRYVIALENRLSLALREGIRHQRRLALARRFDGLAIYEVDRGRATPAVRPQPW